MSGNPNPNPTPEVPTPETGINAGLIKTDLFRFVTLRSPEIVEDEVVDDLFVSIADNLSRESTFIRKMNTATNESERNEFLKIVVNGFSSESFKTKNEIKTYVGSDLYDFSVWLTANRTTLDLTDVFGQLETVTSTLDSKKRLKLWDNLFYQISTYKSGPVRDLLFSILIADSFIIKRVRIEKSTVMYRRLAQARVIIPTVLFKKEAVIGTSISSGLSTKTLDKELNNIILEETLNHYKAIKIEIDSVQTSYTKVAQENYERVSDEYQKKIAKAYEVAKTKDIKYVNPITGVEHIRTEYTGLKIPEFSYSNEEELDLGVLKESVTEDTFSYISDLKSSKSLSTFNEINDELDKEIGAITQTFFEEAELTQSVVNYNGALVPITEEPVQSGTFSIYGTRIVPPTLLFATNFQNAYVVSGNYKIVFNDGTEVVSIIYENNIVNDKLVIKLSDDQINIIGKQSFTLTGEFSLNNNKKFIIEGSGIITRRRYGLGRRRYRLRGNGTFQLEIIDATGGGNSGNNNGVDYIPSGFGIKRMGIADYRKVEQTICCYVPGEVSHIENIMAREYKEKSTRRLRRQEDTTTTSSETEIEKLTDTTSTDRFEMNQEVASVITEDKQTGAFVEANYDAKPYSITAGADFASNTSSEESNSQSVTYAKDVTERALERVVQKTKKERVVKIIEEFEENNTHGFDNRQGDKHISGVYRWVDKIYKNQVLNYGKRLMYEFMIPEPAAFHNTAIEGVSESVNEVLVKPVDPRTVTGGFNLSNFNKITTVTYAHWAGIYNAEVSEPPKTGMNIGKAFSYQAAEVISDNHERYAESTELDIPEGYYSTRALARWSHSTDGGTTPRTLAGGYRLIFGVKIAIPNHVGKIPVSYSAHGQLSGSVNIVIELKVLPEYVVKWKIETFNKIIKAYENKLAEYNSKIGDIKKFGVNPGFYRQIENMVLRKNCISYLASHVNVGANFLNNRTDIQDFTVNYQDENLESYVARVKFFEQAFEWNIMSYNFYPFYWADKSKWKELYNVTEFNDPLHRSFLQSGMARVVVTVRPGFEEVVNWYMATGQIWNGGQVPTMDDELFVSIVEELQNPEFAIEETWESRVPTSLTVIQAGAIGLNVQGLPCNTDCNDFRLFDSDGAEIFDADGNSFANPLEQTDAQVGGNSAPEITDTSGEARK
ncbi:MAG: hypothetical protein HRT69_02295 [Flavobacteriaceae bacterium]|nr:hypothetical protein [Flavobacteriaceae bacterium]